LGNELASALQRGCRALGLKPGADRCELLLAYMALLQKWNTAYNLTAVREPAEMVTRHLLDSLAVAPLLHGRRLIDVGSGAGLPGVPLAICAPQRQFHLLDSNGKRTRFLFQVKTALGLDNIEVQRTRVESFRPALPYDAVLSRAFASLQEMVSSCRHLLAPGGRFLAMKGLYPAQELAAVAGECEILGVHPLEVPGLGERRHLVEMAMRQDTQQQ
jgi:16S rRNA (guanine527-N7)-methyltransferase